MIPTSDDRLARRNAFVLACAQAIGGAVTSITMALGGLVGIAMLRTHPELATVPVTAMIVGTACGTLPAAFILAKLGRKRGFLIGAATAGVGGLVAFAGIMSGAFALYCAGTFVSGLSFAYVQQYRFAATEAASERFRPKAISYVLAGGVFAGVIGPQTVIFTKDFFLPTAFAGAYLAQAGLAIITALVLLNYREVPPPPEVVSTGPRRPLHVILRHGNVPLAIACAVASYAVMALMMTAAPLAMVGCGYPTEVAALGIQWHVIAMFAPSFFTGSLIARFGSMVITAIGLALLALSAVVALFGIEIAHFYGALILLGLGWNFGFIGGTAMLTEAQRPDERVRTQAANEVIVFASVALASLSSGVLYQGIGWGAIAWTLLVLVALPFVALIVWFALSARRGGGAARTA